MEWPLVQAASAAALVYAVPHFAFHVVHLEELSTGDQVAQTVTLALALAIAIPLVLLLLASVRLRAWNSPTMEPRIQYAQTSDGVSIAHWTLGQTVTFWYTYRGVVSKPQS